MIKISHKFKAGFTVMEIMLAIGVMSLLVVILFSSLLSFKKDQSLEKDTETIVEILRQAHSQTLSSKNSSVYGVHFTAPKVTIFSGNTYNISDPNNQDFNLAGTDTILTITLTGGGSDVVFKRLTGETTQNGTVVVSSPGITQTRTVTIYKTGLVESN